MSSTKKKTGIFAVAVVALGTSLFVGTNGSAGPMDYAKPYAGDLGRCVSEYVLYCQNSGQASSPGECASKRRMRRFARKCLRRGRGKEVLTR